MVDCVVDCRLRAAVNPLRVCDRDRQRFAELCHCQLRKQWRDVYVTVMFMLFTKQNRILLKNLKARHVTVQDSYYGNFVMGMWSRVSLDQLLRIRRVTNFLQASILAAWLLKLSFKFPYLNKNSGDEIANVNFYAVRPEATRIRWNSAK